MKTVFRFIPVFCLTLFSALISFSQDSAKIPAPAIKSVFSTDLLWMMAAIIVLLLLILLMPKNTKRTTIYIKDENGNTKITTQTIIRGKKVAEG